MNLRHLAACAAAVVSVGALAQETVPLTPLVQPGADQGKPGETAKPKKNAKPVYDESADAKKQVAAAVAAAKKDNRRVLIQWGGNWCPWCIKLHDLCTTNGDIKKELLYEYDVVHVDVGHFDKNTDLAKKYGADIKGGVPLLTVLDGDGKVVVNQETGVLEDGPKHDPAKVLSFLKEHEAAHLAAGAVLEDGLARAKKEHRQVFLHFGAPWCGWCHRLENWMARREVGAILGKDFVDVKIDQDRMGGAEEVSKKFRKTQDGIPWFCILDADGNVVATSDGAKGNIGFPSKGEEIDHFVGMMTKARKNMSAADVQKLRETLENDGKKSGGEG
jgi:thiol-disulfide isomerase/thioredoxin